MENQQANKPKRKTWTEQLMGAVRFYHALTGMKYEAIGKRALKNPRVWERMEQGGTITLEKADQLLAWLEGQGVILTPEGEPHDEANRRGEEDRRREKSIQVGEQKAGEE